MLFLITDERFNRFSRFSVEERRENNTVTIVGDNCKVLMTADPFRVDIFSDGEPVFSVNSRHMFHIEHLREKPG